jgi:hypothetical protein
MGHYGADVAAAGAVQDFIGAAAGTNDSVRVEGLDNRSGLSRSVQATRRFGQPGSPAVPGTTTIVSATIGGVTDVFLAALGDGWRPAVAFHVTNGQAGGPPPAISGYYTTTSYIIDRAGNVSGCPFTGAVSGSICTAAPPSTSSNTNPAMPANGPAGSNQNLFVRRTLAYDSLAPQVTGVSPNNAYTGNSIQTWALGSQDDLEVIDARLRIHYPNVTQGDGVPTASSGLVWSYALSNTFMGPVHGLPTGPFSAGPASGNGTNWGFFAPIASRFDASVINPQVSTLTQDKFTLNVQETCLGAASPVAACVNAGDPIPAASVPFTKPDSLAVQVRDVFGSWIFNSVASAVTGVSAEFASPILSATVAAPGGYQVTYAAMPPGCPTGGGPPGGLCVTGGVNDINFRMDGAPSAAVRNFRAVQALSITIPIFTRVELYGLNAAGEWVFIQRCGVPSPIPPAGTLACTNGAGTVTGTDNGLERYWVYSFTSIPTAGFSQFRALGVNAAGFGLFSTRQP